MESQLLPSFIGDDVIRRDTMLMHSVYTPDHHASCSALVCSDFSERKRTRIYWTSSGRTLRPKLLPLFEKDCLSAIARPSFPLSSPSPI